MHGAGILPSRAAFRVEGSEIMHGAKNLPALLGLFVTAACSLVEWALPPHRPYLVCLTHERTPAILVALTAIVITPCRRLAIAAPPARCPRLIRPRSARRSRYCAPSGSRPGDVAPWRYRPQPAIASRRTACVPPACDRRRSRYLAPRRHPRRHLRCTRPAARPPPAAPRPSARVPLRFRQFPRNGAVIQLPIQENFVSKDKQ